MNRRTAIRHVVLVSAGAALLPSCFRNTNTGFPLKNITVSSTQQDMLAALAEAIIPKTNNFIGAKDIKAHEFILTMVDDCFSPDDQKKFTDGLTAFDQLSHDTSGQSFTKMTTKQKNELLAALEIKKDGAETTGAFYNTVKRLTVQAFTTSKIYMTDVRHYKMVPGGNFKGCVKMKQA